MGDEAVERREPLRLRVAQPRVEHVGHAGEAERPERYRTLAFEECRVGAFAPAKTLSVFALIDGQWREA